MSALCCLLRQVQVAEGGCEHERVVGGVREQLGSALALLAGAGDHVDVELVQQQRQVGSGLSVAWSRAVLRGVLDALGGLAERSGVVEACVLAAWLAGDDAYVVCRKAGQRGIFGYCFNTYEPYAGTLWPEPEEVAYEHALLGMHEPHEEASEQDIELGRVTCWGSVGSNVPVCPDAVPPPGVWTSAVL